MSLEKRFRKSWAKFASWGGDSNLFSSRFQLPLRYPGGGSCVAECQGVFRRRRGLLKSARSWRHCRWDCRRRRLYNNKRRRRRQARPAALHPEDELCALNKITVIPNQNSSAFFLSAHNACAIPSIIGKTETHASNTSPLFCAVHCCARAILIKSARRCCNLITRVPLCSNVSVGHQFLSHLHFLHFPFVRCWRRMRVWREWRTRQNNTGWWVHFLLCRIIVKCYLQLFRRFFLIFWASFHFLFFLLTLFNENRIVLLKIPGEFL